jgi:prephenate dehydrogenase
LPHLLACQLVNYTLGHPAAAQPLLCATGFRDTTRIASGSPEMWRDIAVANRTNLARSLREFMAELRRLQRAVQAGDEKALADFFDLARQRRDAWCNRAGHASPE